MADPVVPVSWGELLDKVAILEIKRLRLRAPEAVANAERELSALAEALATLEPAPAGLAALRAALAAVNQRLWVIEDRIRERPRDADIRIIPRNATLTGGLIQLGLLILNFTHIRYRCKPVRKAHRNEKLGLIVRT